MVAPEAFLPLAAAPFPGLAFCSLALRPFDLDPGAALALLTPAFLPLALQALGQ